MKLLRILAISVVGFLFVPAIIAQDATPAPVPPVTKRRAINQRRNIQQQRIGNGVENGSLTAGEASRIERQETGLNKEVRNMKSDGNLTPQERRRVQRQQNRLSNEIYQQKHDRQVQPPVRDEVSARQKMQQERIGQGIQNGSLTPREAANVEHREALENKEIHAMRRTGGGLGRGEKAVVNRQQNQLSKQIYHKKHNARTR